MTSRLLTLLLCLAAGFHAALAVAAAPPDEAAFTAAMAERFRAAMPGERIAVAEPLQLRLGEGADAGEINLGRIWNFCAHNPADECELATEAFVAAIARGLGDEGPVRPEQLRVAVRHTDFCDYAARELGAGGGEARALTRPVAPQLCAVLMADYPETMRVLGAADLAGLGLDADAAWALAERQTFANLPEPDSWEGLADGVVAVVDYEYIPSLLLNAEGWRRAAAAAGGELIVAVPEDGILIAARRSSIDDLAGFAATTREGFATGARGISPLVYRWTGSGWAPVE